MNFSIGLLLVILNSSCSLTEEDKKKLYIVTINDLKDYSLIDVIIDNDRAKEDYPQKNIEKQYLKEREKYYKYCFSKDKHCDISIDVKFDEKCIDDILYRDVSITYIFDKESYLFFNRNDKRQQLIGITGLRGRKNCLDDLNNKTKYIWENKKGNKNGK